MFIVLQSRKPSLKLYLSLLVCGALLVGFACYLWTVKTVTIVDNGSQVEVRTLASTVEELLQAQKIILRPEDVVRPSLSASLKEDSIVTIARAVPVRVVEKGETKIFYVAEPTVAKVLNFANIVLNPLDEITYNLDVIEETNKYIKVTHIAKEKVEEITPLDFPVKREPDQFLAKGETAVVQDGEQGLVKETVMITYADGEETKREVIKREIVKEPKPKIIAYGIKDQKAVQTSRELQGRKSFLMEATAYTHTGNRTATGINPYRGVIAVDPEVIPLGTELYVEGYGYGEALDTGGTVKGNRIDLFFETKSEALNWGRRNVQVYILD